MLSASARFCRRHCECTHAHCTHTLNLPPTPTHTLRIKHKHTDTNTKTKTNTKSNIDTNTNTFVRACMRRGSFGAQVLDSKTLSTAAEIADEVQIFSHLNLGICCKSCISMPKTVFPKMTLSAVAYLADEVFVSHIIVQNC